MSVAPAAVADDPITPSDPSITPTSAPPVTGTAPGSTVPGSTAPSTTAPSSTSSTTTTTDPESSTTTRPATTQPPVDDATIEAGSDGGFASTPAPFIPSMEDDPLFHAARTVDADLRNVAIAEAAHLKQIAATREVAKATAAERAAFERVETSHTETAAHLSDTRSILRAAALHAYAGYGSEDAATGVSEIDGARAGSLSPSRTYVRVTIADATRHVSDAEAERTTARSKLDTAERDLARAEKKLDDARRDERAAKKAVEDAKETLERNRADLRRRIGEMADFAPGAFDDLPDVAELPEGATAVESPVGTIIVPDTADQRTAIALQYVIAQIGKPYIWGGTGPTGFDCSGLLLRGFQAAGVTSMPRVSQGQQVWAEPIEREDLQPGDFVFFGTPAYHIGVYIGGGLMINAPYTGARVRVDKVWSTVSGYGRAIW